MDFTKANPQNWSSGQSSSSSGNGFDKFLAGAVPGSGLVSAGVNLLDSLFGFSANRQHRHQKELMDKQQSQWLEQFNLLQEKALEQWNRENEYNDPSNAFKRLLQGAEVNGITKSAVLGGHIGGVSGQTNSSFDAQGNTAMTSTAGSGLLPMGSPAVLGSMKQRAEISLLEAQAEKMKAETESEYTHRQLMRSQEGHFRTLQTYNADMTLDGPFRRASMAAQEWYHYKMSDKAESEALESFANAFYSYERGKYVEPGFMISLYDVITDGIWRKASAEAERSLAKLNDFDLALFQEVRDEMIEERENSSLSSKYGAQRDSVKVEREKLGVATDTLTNKSLGQEVGYFYTDKAWDHVGQVLSGASAIAQVALNFVLGRQYMKNLTRSNNIKEAALKQQYDIKQEYLRRYNAKKRK